MNHELAFIGAGNMAEAMARSIVQSGLFSPERIIAADPSPGQLERFTSQKISTTSMNSEAARGASTIVLSVKPQMMSTVLADLKSVVSDGQLVVSIAAGISTRFIEQNLNVVGACVVRAMPNTPMLVGLGATAICRGTHATAQDLADARRLFECASVVVEVQEHLMNAVTAVSGSGPAYFFYLVEQMIAAATKSGLTPEQARTLVYRTASGAAKLLETSADSPAELRRKVTSPGGTTQAAIEVFENRGVAAAIQDAVIAAEKRGREIGG